MIAIVMAGGKGMRMESDIEKPLIGIGGKTLIERVASAIKKSGLGMIIAISADTPETRKKAIGLGLDVIETPGGGYVRDIQFIFRKMRLDNALVVSADLPFITPALVQMVVKKYNDVKRPVCVVTPLEGYEKLGCRASVTIDHNREKLVPVGINVVEKTRGEDYIYKITGRETLNVNTLDEIEIVEGILEMDEAKKLRALLQKAVDEKPPEGILFSGGLDTSIIAFLASGYSPELFTVNIKDSGAKDIEYSRRLAKRLGLKQYVLELSVEELLENIPETIRILKSFDPMEVRNSVTVYGGLRFAKEHVNSIMTGDGADELFSGYSYMFEKSEKELRDYTNRLAKYMRFSSIELGKAVGIEVNIPYIHPEVKSFAIGLPRQLKINQKGEKTYGKWILRKAFENDLPEEFLWRVKTPIEFGSGSTIITKFLESRTSNEEFNARKKEYEITDNVKLRDKEQLYYYKIYRETFGVPSLTEHGCQYCNSEIRGEINYCRVCGAYPIGGDVK